MSNVIGEAFSFFVNNQIDLRQEALGKFSNISADNLKYYTTKTPWLRLASSVNLTREKEGDDSVLDKLTKVGVPLELIQDDRLAKNFILQGGAVSLEETKDDDGVVISSNVKLQKGLNYNNDIFNGAYGWGGLNAEKGGRGYVPMPGITSANSTYYNNGALSKATINITCYSKAQFQLLDVLYLRPGYTLLLEFGWSTYLDNVSKAVGSYDGFKSSPLSFLLDPSTGDVGNQFEMLELIEKERQIHSGNYEAIYGKITNFKWSFGSDGSYNCEISLIGMGDIIESLKLNVTDPNLNDQSDKDESSGFKSYEQYLKDFFNGSPTIADAIIASSGENDAKPIKSLNQKAKNDFLDSVRNPDTGFYMLNTQASSENIANYFTPKYDELKREYEQNETLNNSSNPLLSNRNDTILNKEFYDISQRAQQQYALKGGETLEGGLHLNFGFTKNSTFIIGQTLNGEKSITPGGDKTTKSVFIKFGTLLNIIENNCNLFSLQGGKTPMIRFDFSYSNMLNDSNYMLTIPPHISTNPQKCIVPYIGMGIEGIIDFQNKIDVGNVLNKELQSKTGFQLKDNPYVGRLANVHINLRFAADALANSPKDDDGAIAVLDYLKTILQGINESMGNINNFKVNYDEVRGVIKIYDESPKPNLVEELEDNFTKLNIYGVKENLGSFVTNISLNAEIPKNFASMIAIGAQASGNNLMNNSTSFSSYNKGLIDRIIPEKLDAYTINKKKTEPNPLEQAKTIRNEKIFYPSTIDTISPLGSMYLKHGKGEGASTSTYNFTPEVSNDFTENYTSYLKLIQGVLADNNKVPSPFFLPFNLNLELEGISGIRLFEKFRITDDILPPSYEKDSVDIIVKGINHSVDTKKWSTTIDTLSVPRFQPVIIDPPVSSSVSTNDDQKKLEEIANGDEPPIETDNPNKIVRMRQTRIVDDGYQTYGMLEILAEDGSTLYALPTTELPWENNQNKESCFPLGTYDCTSRKSPRHGKCFAITTVGRPLTGKPGTSTPFKGGVGITESPININTRDHVLIHPLCAARNNDGKKILLGCIAPGERFNPNSIVSRDPNPKKNKKEIYDKAHTNLPKSRRFDGNPRGTGPQHGYSDERSLSGVETQRARDRYVNSLWEIGLDPRFMIEVIALDRIGDKPGATKFYSEPVQNFIRSIEAKTGETYQIDM